MSELILCSSCARHIRKDEPRCPFCDAVVSEEQRAAATVAAVAPGTSRARAYAARVAVIAGSTALACSGTTKETLPRDAGSEAAEGGNAGNSGSAGTGGTINIGGTINTGGRGGTNSGGTNSGGMGNTGNIPLPYGTVWPDDEEF